MTATATPWVSAWIGRVVRSWPGAAQRLPVREIQHMHIGYRTATSRASP